MKGLMRKAVVLNVNRKRIDTCRADYTGSYPAALGSHAWLLIGMATDYDSHFFLISYFQKNNLSANY